MDSDFSDAEDDKTHVRSAIDAMGDSMTKSGKKRGRPRKYPVASTSSAGSSRKKSPSRARAASESDAESSEGEPKKKKKGSSDDEEWDETIESLSVSQRREMRTRKRPTLYSEESFATDEARRRQSAKRPRGGSGRAKPSPNNGPNRSFTATYNKPAPKLSPKQTKEEQRQAEQWRMMWREMENPMQAKQRVLPFLRRGLFEKVLDQIAPVLGGPANVDIPQAISAIFGSVTCSAGFSEFLKNIRIEAVIAVYEICEKLFVIEDSLPDNIKIAQALRFWWNSLSFATRRKWEQQARSLVYNRVDYSRQLGDRACSDGYEVPVRNVSAERLAEEEKWEGIHSNSLAMLDEIDTVVSCPLCEKDETKDPCKMTNIKEMQTHFFQAHWQVHGYACHFCGAMFTTADELMASHSDCAQWVAWNAARILTGSVKTGKLGMSFCRMLLCCSDCGWHTTLSKNRKKSEEAQMNYIKTFFAHHNNDGLLTMLIYFAGDPSNAVTSVRFQVTSMAGGDPQAPCVHCGPSVSFRDPIEADEHYTKEHRDMAVLCEECTAPTTTDYLLKQHQMSHLHDNSYFADYLLNTARIFPPPYNMSCAPRCGWKNRTKGEHYAVGGIIGGVGANTGMDLIDPNEDITEAKARLMKKRRKEGKPALDRGYENTEIEVESDMARKVREKLIRKYGDYEGMGGFEDPVWLKDADALKFKEWMDYWESEEGRRLGGPPEELEVDLSSSAVRIPSVDVELKFGDSDVLTGFLLNDNVFYCTECDTILKGEQATEHLKVNGDEVNNCAMDDGEYESNPILNENVFQLYSFAAAPPSMGLPCPHCSVWVCSITGLRVHAMVAHGIFVKYAKTPNETVTNVELKFDIRTRLAKKIDAKLGMLPSGMLPQRRPLVTEVNVIDKAWSVILLTKDNCDPVLYNRLKQFIELEKQQEQAITTSPRALASPYRGGMSMGYSPQRPPFRSDPPIFNRPSPLQRHISLEQSLQLQQQRGNPIPPRTLTNQATPLARQLHTVSRAMNHPPPAAFVRLAGQQAPYYKKLVALSHQDGDRFFYMCQVCSTSALYEAELLKAHMLRCHFHTCGHCTAIFVYEPEARNHTRKCRMERNPSAYCPDPRLPHIRTSCPLCPAHLSMVDMHMHLMDFHIDRLEFGIPHGKLNLKILMVEKTKAVAKEPEVERLRYKYYVPDTDVARTHGFVQCFACGLFLPDRNKLNVHLKLHPEFMYFCWLCPRQSSASLGTVTSIVNHIKEKHLFERGRGFVPCPHCKQNMIDRPMQHLMYECEHNNTCQLCRDLPTFENVADLREHKEKCHYNALRRFECSHCTGYFSTTPDFNRHICDPAIMKTSCTCGVDFKTRPLFVAHFKATHVRSDVCRICCIKYKSTEEQNKHWLSHGKVHQPSDTRYMLLCAYGDLNTEVKALFTHMSNASFRLRNAQGQQQGGTEDSPVQLSDDDDIIEIPSTAVQQERRQAAAAAAHIPLQPNGAHSASSALAAAAAQADTAEVDEVIERLVNTVVKWEEDEMREEGRMGEGEAVLEMPPMLESEDDDVVMIEDASPTRNLSARVREEAVDDDTTVGGLNQPGYKEDEEEPAGTPNQPVIREFTPPDDEELCVVAEVENPGCNTAAATLSKGRPKKFACSKCSDRFITQKRLTDHLQSAHQFDAGQSTILEELGMPMNKPVWICKSCCLSFQTAEQKRTHNSQHGQQTFRCDTCAGSAYNVEVMNLHHRRIQERKISYICGECKLEFECDTALHEHSNARHGVILFYFCKLCEVGSTDGVYAYKHFMGGCNADPRRQQRARTLEEAIKCIGVVPASQLHFQPTSVDNYKEFHTRNPHSFVQPSFCNHRSMIVANERQVTCVECRCLDTIQRHMACLSDTAVKQFEAQMRPMRGAVPLLNIKQLYDKDLQRERGQQYRQQHVDNTGRNGVGAAGHPQRFTGANAPLPVATARVTAGRGLPVSAHHDIGDAQRRMNDRMQSMMTAARINQNGGGGGGGRSPVLTPGTSARQQQHHFHNGGPAILRGAVPYHPTSSRPPPMHSRAPLSTMGSLQSMVALAGGATMATASAAASFPLQATPSPVSAQCQVCSATLLSSRDAFLHSLHTSERGAFLCSRPDCTFTPKDEHAAIKHICSHLEPNQRVMEFSLDCPLCGVNHKSLMSLKHHVVSKHNPPLKHRANSCLLLFGTTALANAHEEIHQASECPIAECCLLCGSMDNWSEETVDNRGKTLSISHMMKHACKHTFYCKICDMKKFEDENQMITHFIMLHTQEEGDSRSCNDCSAVLKTDDDHKKHCLTKHTITELRVPEKMKVCIPPRFSEYLGIETAPM